MAFVVPPDLRSWIPVAIDSHFPIQNIPFGVGAFRGRMGSAVTRIGDQIVHLASLIEAGVLSEDDYGYLLDLEDLEGEAYSKLRQDLVELFQEGNGTLRDDQELRAKALVPANDVQMLLPMEVRAFVDFYSGINHASNVGRMFRPDQPPLLRNYRHLPVGYNGRASSVVVSGQPIRRPNGQFLVDDMVQFSPTRELDFELELGFFLKKGSRMGEPVPIDRCEDHMFGVVLVNDWSARDVQRWEYQPLGPFLAKSFATSISPWIITLDALEPFRVPGPTHDPLPLAHLREPGPSHFNIELSVDLQTANMQYPQTISRTNAKELYWSFAQQLAHQASNGTPVQAGDLYATGTISGTDPDTFGSLLELTWRGERPLKMVSTEETRTFLQDGDTLIMSGWCQGDGFRVGLGEVRSTVQPAPVIS